MKSYTWQQYLESSESYLDDGQVMKSIACSLLGLVKMLKESKDEERIDIKIEEPELHHPYGNTV